MVQMLRHLKVIFYWLRMKLKCITPLKKEEIRRSSVLSTQHCVYLTWKVAVSTCPSDTNTHLAFLKELKPHNIQKEWGWEYSFTFFFFVFLFFSDKWHPDSWKKKCWGPWTDFSVIKIKCVGLDKDRHLTFYFWTPMRATPPPLRLCHDCCCWVFFPSLEMSYIKDSIWHKQKLISSMCTQHIGWQIEMV